MKLKDKFQQWFINDEPISFANLLIEHTKIADEHAIGFANWLETLPPNRKVSMWSKNGELKGLFTMDNEQLLEIYKKEHNL